MMDQLAVSLKDVLENSRTMLNRCTDLCERSSTTCTCKSDLETAQKELKGLRSTCTILETKRREQKEATKEVTRTIKELKVKIGTLLRQTGLDDDKCEAEQNDTNKEVPTLISSKQRDKLEQKQDVKLVATHIEEAKPQDASSKSQPEHLVHFVTSSTSEINSKLQTEDPIEPGIGKVEVVNQERKCVPFGEAYWRKTSQDELEESKTLFFDLEGVHTVLCLDVSESMIHHDGWQQASTFAKDYLQGLQEISTKRGLSNEHVAMVTFGHETVVKQRYSNKYDELLEVFNNLKLGGPSPLFGGMLMSLAAAWSSRHQSIQVGSGTRVWTRIVIISDGRPTDTEIIAGPDSNSPLDTEGTTNLILQEMEHYRSQRFDVFFVPVGNSDNPFFDVMLGISDGIMLDHLSGRRLAKRHYLSTNIMDALGLSPMSMQLTSTSFMSSDGMTEEDKTNIMDALGLSPMSMQLTSTSFMSSDGMTEEDKADIKSIQERTKSRILGGFEMGMDMEGLRQDHYNERQRTALPAVGSRVRRGPDWNWNQQDSSGPGTVIGHHPADDQVWVEWDADKHQNIYRYGNDNYDVIIVDEPRKVSDKRLLAVGCSVKPGVKWKISEPRQKSGAVIKLDQKQKKATVRWDNGRRGEYSYDTINEEIVYSPAFEPFYSKGHTLGYTADDAMNETNDETHRPKNKNVFPK